MTNLNIQFLNLTFHLIYSQYILITENYHTVSYAVIFLGINQNYPCTKKIIISVDLLTQSLYKHTYVTTLYLNISLFHYIILIYNL